MAQVAVQSIWVIWLETTERAPTRVPMCELSPLLEEIVASGGTAELTVTGRSMEPMLHDRQSRVRLRTAPEALRRGDIALYRRDNGRYVLHRVAACRGGAYDFCGDAQWTLECGLRRGQILAVVTEFRRGERWTPVENAAYGVYWRVLLAVRPVRRFAHRAAGWIWRRLKRNG
mgnify:CR=1 FL=1